MRTLRISLAAVAALVLSSTFAATQAAMPSGKPPHPSTKGLMNRAPEARTHGANQRHFCLQAKQRNQAWEVHSTASRHDDCSVQRASGETEALLLRPNVRFGSARCLLYPQKRTSIGAHVMSALCQKQT